MHCSDFYHFDSAGKQTAFTTDGEALDARKTGGFVWLNYCLPEREDLSTVIAALGIHPLSIEDCFDDDQIPKIDIFPEYTEILFNDFSWNDGSVAIIELNLFLGKDFLVTVTREETNEHCPSSKTIEALGLMRAHGIHGPSRILHAILDHIVDGKFCAIEKTEDDINNLEDAVVAGSGAIEPATLQVIRRNLAAMRKSLFHEREILAKICRKDSNMISEKGIIYFSNIYDHLAKYVELVESNRERVTNLVQMHISLTNNEMSKASNRTNRSVSRLTFITTIFMPLTLVAGIGGMSEWTMMTGPENWRISYPVLLGAMAVTGILNFIVLKWLDRRE